MYNVAGARTGEEAKL
jgi:hypothetical protein